MLGGCVSVLSIAYVLLCYHVRGWKRYPNRLLLWKCTADLVTALGVTAFGVADGVSSMWGEEDVACTAFSSAFNPFLLQLGFFASEAWGLLLGYDVIQQIRTPRRGREAPLTQQVERQPPPGPPALIAPRLGTGHPLSSATWRVQLAYHMLAWGSALGWALYAVPLSSADLDWWTPLRRDLGASDR